MDALLVGTMLDRESELPWDRVLQVTFHPPQAPPWAVVAQEALEADLIDVSHGGRVLAYSEVLVGVLPTGPLCVRLVHHPEDGAPKVTQDLLVTVPVAITYGCRVVGDIPQEDEA